MNDVLTFGEIPPMPIPVLQNGVTYFADILHGQKTGWYFDQRANHALFASHCKGKTVLDVYAHSGGFGLLAAKEGAAQVTLVDRSSSALALAQKSIDFMQFTNVEMIEGEAFEVMQQLHEAGHVYDCVSVDPPAFVKHKRDIASGMKGYEKCAFYGAQLTAKGGVLMLASCSHHATPTKFYAAVQQGIKRAGRTSSVISKTGASADHPIHPHLPQTQYLKAILLTID